MWALGRQDATKLSRDFGYRLCWFDDLKRGDLGATRSPALGSTRFAVGQPNAVVMAKGLDRQVYGFGEVADADRRWRHHDNYRLSPQEESTVHAGLDSPTVKGRILARSSGQHSVAVGM